MKMDHLYTHGFVVLNDTFKITSASYQKIKQSDFENIFNQKSKGRLVYNGMRKQSLPNSKWSVNMKKRLQLLLRKHNILQKDHVAKNLVALYSKSGCPKQIEHCDSAHENTFKGKHLSDTPLACLVAIEDDTKIYMRSLLTNKSEKIKLSPGKVLVFRGDVRHSGAEYKRDNIRLHMYIDSKSYVRPNDTTFL